jgi:protein O-GlcNAc transferase
LQPRYAEAHSALGTALHAQGKVDEAAACYHQALELNPNLPRVRNNLGNLLWVLGRPDDALECYLQEVELNPDLPEVHINLGTVFSAQGHLEKAISYFRRAIELNPNLPEAHNNLANALRAQGKLNEAVSSFRLALQLKPDFAEAFANLGNVFEAQGKLDLAVDAQLRALEFRPDFAEVHNNLAKALHSQGKMDDAVSCCRRAIELKPDYADAQSNLGNILKDQGKLDEAIASFRRAIELKADCFAAQSSLLYSLWFSPNFDAAAIYDEHCRWSQQWAEPLGRNIVRHANDPTPDRRLRIGYVSPDFRSHVLSFSFVPLFAAHDHQQFEIVCYSDVAVPDSITSRLRSYVDRWTDIVGLTDDQLAQLVHQDQIDILVDLTMHMAIGRPFVFARAPAPVQVCGLAYPGTTGIRSIDYRLTDSHLDPPDRFDQYYSEQSIRLPDSFWCYDPLTTEPVVESLAALSNGYITFGCLNNFCKVNASVLALWARVLNAVERSRLLLLAPEGSARQNVLRFLGAAGLSADRITFVARQPRPTYLELYNQIDIVLDTFPYNGHTTSLDSFWMGVPVVTLVGRTVVGRAGLSQLENLSLTELVAHSPDQFVEISVGLAKDLPRLTELHKTLRERIEKSPLMDATRFARNVEAAYRAMWRAWCDAPR